MAGTRAMKEQMGTFGSLIPKDFPSLGSPWLLSGLASLYGRSRLADRVRLANLTISNVPGPQVPLYLAGAKMSGIYPLSIVVHGVALNITVQSYLGQLCFGLIACRRAVPDVHELAEQMQSAMRALLKLPMPAVAEVETMVLKATPAQAVPATVKPRSETAVKPRTKRVGKPHLKVVPRVAPPKTRRASAGVAKAAR